MSTLDRQPRTSSAQSGPLYERRVDPGTAQRVNIDPPSRLSPAPPKTPMVVTPKPLKR